MTIPRTLLVSIVWGTLVAPLSPAYAQDDTAPVVEEERRKSLAERIPAVSGRFFVKEGRLEVAPAVGLSLNDPFYDHIPLGGSLVFHILESLAIGASGEFYASVETPVDVAPGEHPVPKYNRPSYAARLDIGWAPIYGKLSLMAETVLHFDTYLNVSAGVVGPTKTSPTFAWGFALGQHYFVNEWLAVKLEVRDQFFELARNPDEDKKKTWQTLLTAAVGVCFYLPTEVERETL